MIRLSLALGSLIFLVVPASSSANPNTLDVVLSLPLSGPVASFGTAVRNGVELAKREEPRSFEKVRISYDDNGFDPKRAVTGYQVMYADGDADLLFVWGSQPCLAVAPLAERDAFPLFCFSGDPKPGLEHVVSFVNPAPDYARLLLGYLHEQKFRKVALVVSELGFFLQTGEALTSILPKSVELVQEKLSPETRDVASIVSRLKRAAPDAIGLFLLPDQLAAVAKQLRSQGLTSSFFSLDTLSSSTLLSENPGLFDGAAFADISVPPAFPPAYRETYRTDDYLTFAYNGYEFAKFVSRIAQRCTGDCNRGVVRSLTRTVQPETAPQFRTYEGFGNYFAFPLELRKILGTTSSPLKSTSP